MSEAKDIQIPDIEKALEGLCSSSNQKNYTKACLFTLIIYAHEPERVKYHLELVGNILDKFPCRIIFIQIESHADKYLHVDVANVTRNREDTAIVCDQITIRSSPSELSRVPYIVIPHIVPDLPVYLLWSQTPFLDHTIFPALQPYASRIIFDSECSESLHQFSKEMLQNLDLLKMDVMDINWALISNWRGLFAQLFDSPARLSVLQKCKSLKIVYNIAGNKNTRHPAMRALYLQGWLASCLGWTYRSSEKLDDVTMIVYAAKENPSIVTLCPQSTPNLSQGSIVSIEVNSIDGHTIFISRKQSLSLALIHASSQEQCELPFTLALPDVHQGLAFMKEIFYHTLDHHYRDVLKFISHMDETVLS